MIPAEYDVFIDWSPLSFKRGTEQEPLEAGKGKFQFLHKWIPESELDSYRNDDTVEIVDRLPPLEVVTNDVTGEEEVVDEIETVAVEEAVVEIEVVVVEVEVQVVTNVTDD